MALGSACLVATQRAAPEYSNGVPNIASPNTSQGNRTRSRFGTTAPTSMSGKWYSPNASSQYISDCGWVISK